MPTSIKAYEAFIPPELLARLSADAEAVPTVTGLRIARGLRGAFPRVETDEALGFMVGLYDDVADELADWTDSSWTK